MSPRQMNGQVEAVASGMDSLRLVRSGLQFFRQPGCFGGIDRLCCLHFLKYLFRRPRVCATLLEVADNPTLPHQVLVPLGKVSVYLQEVPFKSTSFHGHQPRQ
jgi:hypothetical protein